MLDNPSGAALLEVAEQALMTEIAPALEGGKRYTALMIANAMRIVAREINVAATAARTRGRVLGDGPGSPDDLAMKLTQSIRAGACDGDVALHKALCENAVVAASIWKPTLASLDERRAAGLDEHAKADRPREKVSAGRKA